MGEATSDARVKEIERLERVLPKSGNKAAKWISQRINILERLEIQEQREKMFGNENKALEE
jgi:hypothetical protein